MGIALKISKVALQNVFKDTKTNFAKNKSDLLASDKNVGANEDTTSNIEWNHLNYPWVSVFCVTELPTKLQGLNLVHYNARELDAKASNLSRIAHYATFIVYGALSLNLLDVIILAVSAGNILDSHLCRASGYLLCGYSTAFSISFSLPPLYGALKTQSKRFRSGTFYLSFVILATKSSRYLRSYTASQSMLVRVNSEFN
ncbi:uncharacterized protein BXIN_2070 [Babesia sp. Xinjiang]|uniref:uncharacterized protein n=1 Tax=Babesia sp. Xinjiang TaxID=462227 RepID=UPI000A256809|nr:uncharacterized protein BXIN_2070 [Babesia sp. Xinjiang]ORM40247.1 hypothetical protein BXIN_2070 [Babesia sp. Xinjiang]